MNDIKRPSRGHVGPLVALALLVAVLGFFYVFRWNQSDSVPPGTWLLHGGDVEHGTFVVMCLPAPIGAEALYHHYLTPGGSGCPSGAKPVVKVAVGLPGDRVALGRGTLAVYVAGRQRAIELDPCGQRHARGTDGAPIRAFVALGSFTIGRGELWLCGLTSDSWDSRYFGPVPIEGMRGVATPVSTQGTEWKVYNTWLSLFARRD
jgi:conjugative transfer signal peptidase TraF